MSVCECASVCVTVIMGFCVEELSTSFIVFYGSASIFWVTLPFYYAFRKSMCAQGAQGVKVKVSSSSLIMIITYMHKNVKKGSLSWGL